MKLATTAAGMLLLSVCLTNCGGEKKQDEKRDFSGDKFKDNVRVTEARSPEDERKGFKLPDGFEITLFASEPDIGKPINLAFDAKGRVWVTQSLEYPFPSEPGKGRDKLTILEDTDNDGKADKFTVFSDTLNIPIGVLPMNDGAVVYSIPNIYKFNDANGDLKIDGQKKLVGPFRFKDTHGMINNFVRGYDGWIHSCHGYTNRDTVAGADGDSISMISGNTFRFKPDGSRVEHTTDGRINPFGLVYDERGYLYSTDCHTSPIYQLIMNADYTQWGKEEGMGFAPDMTPLTDEATALAGIGYYSDALFPEPYQKNFYVGDVVRCRVYRYSSTFNGSTPVGKKEEDFLLSEDPWFRPVDVKLGPDGAIYVADFYNKIIGHYEVPLDHPQRDHARGRIWRITYKGKENKKKDWTAAALAELLEALDAENMPSRMMATDQLTDRIAQQAVQPVSAILKHKQVSARKYVHALWILERLNALTPAALQEALGHSDATIRLHAYRALAEMKIDPSMYQWVEKGISDKDAHVRRAAVELLGKFPGITSLNAALAVRRTIPEKETHLLYATRLSLRTILRNDSVMRLATKNGYPDEDATNIADVLMGVPSEEAGSFLYNYINKFNGNDNKLASIYRHIARFAPYSQLDSTIAIAFKSNRPDSVNLLLYRGFREGLTQRGGKENSKLVEWGKSLAQKVLVNYPFVKQEPYATMKLQTFAADIVGANKIKSAVPALQTILQKIGPSDFRMDGSDVIAYELMDLKTAAVKALLRIDPAIGSAEAVRVLNDKDAEINFKNSIGRSLADFPAAISHKIFEQVKNAPPDLQTNIATTLSGSSAGKDILFNQVQRKQLYPRVLLQPVVQERIFINITPAQKKKFEELTAGVDKIDKERDEEIAKRVTSFEHVMESSPPPTAEGKKVFMQFCSSCHSVAEEGGNIGPNLDGLAQWGPKAISEKVLDPNRNISENFRNYSIKLKDGKLLSGLYRRDEGAVEIFADLTGKEFSVAKKDIAEKSASKLTLMPDNFRERISEKDFNALLHFLLKPKG